MIQSNNIFSLALSHRLVNIDDFGGMGTVVCACCLFHLYMALRICGNCGPIWDNYFNFVEMDLIEGNVGTFVHFVEFSCQNKDYEMLVISSNSKIEMEMLCL